MLLQTQRVSWLRSSVTLLLLAIACSVHAAPEFPVLTERVVDDAGLLGADMRQTLISELAAHEQATSNQVVVVTLPSLQGYSIDDFGYQLGRHWGIGQKKRDNGVLLIVAPNERKVRIEVGYGLEGTLTDALSHNIIQTIILPQFKKGDMQQGIIEGARAIMEALVGTYEPLPEKKSSDRFSNALMLFIVFIGFGEYFVGLFNSRLQSSGILGVIAFGVGWLLTGLIVAGLVLGFFVTLFHYFIGGGGGSGGSGGYGGSGSGGYSGGSFGGGSFGGGGGSFGGGGASGGW